MTGCLHRFLIVNGTPPETSQVNSGVKQGCEIVPTDGKLFNLSRLKSKSKTTTTVLPDFQYAGDNSVAPHSKESLQTIHQVFEQAYYWTQCQLQENADHVPTSPL